MKKLVIAAMIWTASLGSSLQPAQAAANIVVAGPGAFVAGFATPQVVLDPSLPAKFINGDIDDHNVVSVAKRKVGTQNVPLFSTPDVPAGAADIQFLPNITPGDYKFICTLHGVMLGTATITYLP